MSRPDSEIKRHPEAEFLEDDSHTPFDPEFRSTVDQLLDGSSRYAFIGISATPNDDKPMISWDLPEHC